MSGPFLSFVFFTPIASGVSREEEEEEGGLKLTPPRLLFFLLFPLSWSLSSSTTDFTLDEKEEGEGGYKKVVVAYD